MKKILFVIENLQIGGIQKSLVNLLNEISELYEIDLAAFDPTGEYSMDIPATVHIIKLPKLYRVFALNRKNLKKNKMLWLYKTIYFLITNIINKGVAFKLLTPFYKLNVRYDVAISYSHSGYYKSVNGICPEFVLYKTKADKKVCFIHCDYDNSGYKCDYNNTLYSRFDGIACCSESVKEVLLKSIPSISQNTYTVRNFYDTKLSNIQIDNLHLSPDKIHVFSVSRLSKEKGIIRVVEAIYYSGRKDIDYYIIGNGPLKNEIDKYIHDHYLCEQVHILGAMNNPYPVLLNADYLIVPSLNEAAPMVFDEAHILGIPIIATLTTSAKEMLDDSNDIICENSIEALKDIIKNLKYPQKMNGKTIYNNEMQKKQIKNMINSLCEGR